jgi:hypothetical protein
MKAFGKAFQLLDEGAPDPVAHTRINVHMVFDVKADVTRKSRLVMGRRSRVEVYGSETHGGSTHAPCAFSLC